MPTYEYECTKCGYVFEEFQSISAEPIKKCKKEGCDGTVKRLFSPGAGFLFKGSGFYITDYRSDSYKKREKSDTSSSTADSTSDSAKKTDSGSSSAATKKT
jgi:putative FmdB family regulatory protein